MAADRNRRWWLTKNSVPVLYFLSQPEVEKDRMKEDIFYVLRQKAVPEVLLKVVEAKALLEQDQNLTVQEAVSRTGLSRSSFYKYKDDIFPFREHTKGRNLTFVLQMDDVPGLLSRVLSKIAQYNANVLTIQQSIPVNGRAALTISLEVLDMTGDVTEMFAEIEDINGVHDMKILARE